MGHIAPRWPLRINRDSPLATGLARLWPMSPPGLVLARDISDNNEHFDSVGAAGSVAFDHTPQGGHALDFDGTADGYVRNDSSPVTTWTGGITVALEVRSDSSAVFGNPFWCGASGSEDQNFSLLHFGGDWWARRRNVASLDTGVQAVVQGQWERMVIQVNTALTRLYINGVKMTDETTSSTPAAAFDRTSLGKDDRLSPQAEFPGAVANVHYWTRQLSETEVFYWFANPYELIEPERTLVAVPDSTPPPVVGVPDTGSGTRLIRPVLRSVTRPVLRDVTASKFGGAVEGHAYLDGIASYMVYDARVIGTDDPEWSGAMFVKIDDITTHVNNIILGGEDATTQIYVTNAGLFVVVGAPLFIPSVAGAISSATWHCVMFNGNGNDVGAAQLRVDDAIKKDASLAITGNVDFAQRFELGADGTNLGSGTFSGVFGMSLGPVVLWHGTQTNWNVAATRRLFLNADGSPNYDTMGGDMLGFNGVAPTVALNQLPAKYPINLSGQNLGLVGALGDATGLPIDVTMGDGAGIFAPAFAEAFT